MIQFESQQNVPVDYKVKCVCDDRKPLLVNHDMLWHDGDVICENCRGFIRFWDAG